MLNGDKMTMLWNKRLLWLRESKNVFKPKGKHYITCIFNCPTYELWICGCAVSPGRERWGKEADWLVAAGTSSSGGWRRGCSWYHRLWSLWECNQVVTWPCWTPTLASCALSGLLSTPLLYLMNLEEMCFLFYHMHIILGVWWFGSDNVAPQTYEP